MILCIDTAIDNCSVGLCQAGTIVDSMDDPIALKASEVLHIKIDELTERNSVQYNELTAVAVNGGPGSYTGLRIGASSAKGFCYALNIPLIHVDGLQLIKNAFIARYAKKEYDLYAAMVDARRDEVFMMIVDKNNNIILEPQAIILQKSTLEEYTKYTMAIVGNGAQKAEQILDSTVQFDYFDCRTQISDFNDLVSDKWKHKDFEDYITYAPHYLKKFHFTGKKPIRTPI